MDDKCEQPSDIYSPEVFSKTDDLIEKMGGDQVCKKAASTDATNFSTSGGVSGEVSGYGARVAAEAHFQASGGTVSNQMEQSGCGTLLIAAQKIVNNTKSVNCIIQKAAQTSEMDVGINASIKIRTLPLTVQEISDKQQALAAWDANNKFSDYSAMYYDNVDRFNAAAEKSALASAAKGQVYVGPIPMTIKLTDVAEAYAMARKSISDAYSRNINMEGVNISQTISGKIKIVSQLSSSDAAKVEALTKEIASTVAQAAIEQKSGLNAMDPNLKSVTDTTTSTTQNLSSTSVNNKIQSSKASVKMNAEILIEAPSTINMKNVQLNQNIMADIVCEAIINSAVDSGIKAANEITSNSAIMTSLRQESAGVDDLVRAQGEANAAAINAAKIPILGSSDPSILGVIALVAIAFILKTFSQNIPALTFMIVVLGLFVLSIISFTAYGRNITGKQTEAEKEALMKRPLALYNKIWKSFGSTRELTLADVLPLEGMSDIQLRISMEGAYNKAILPDASEADISFCFEDGLVPPILYSNVKKKIPSNLTADELKYLWNYSGCNDSESDYTRYVGDGSAFKSLKTIYEVMLKMKKCPKPN